MFIFSLIAKQYQYYIYSIIFNYAFIYKKIYLWQKYNILKNHTVIPMVFKYRNLSLYFLNKIQNAYLLNLNIFYKFEYIFFYKNIYNIPRFFSYKKTYNNILKKFKIYLKNYYQFLTLSYFNLVLKRNTVFLQFIWKNKTILFTTTSTQFGFKKYKRYARFIFDFFLLLSFSYVSDFGLKSIAFKIKLLNYFVYKHLLRKFIGGAFSFRRVFFCRDYSAEYLYFLLSLKLDRYSEARYRYRSLYFKIYNHSNFFKLNLILRSFKYNLLFEVCSLYLFVIIYFQHSLEYYSYPHLHRIVSLPSIKYFFYPFFNMFKLHGLGAFFGIFFDHFHIFFIIIRILSRNYIFFKNFICMYILFYNKLQNFHKFYTRQRRFFAKLRSDIVEYSSYFFNFNILRYIILIFILLLIKLKKQNLEIIIRNKFNIYILNILFLIFKFIFILFYIKIYFDFKEQRFNFIFDKFNLNLDNLKENYFFMHECIYIGNTIDKEDSDISEYNLLKYFLFTSKFTILYRFRNPVQKLTYKKYMRYFNKKLFKHESYVYRSSIKFMNSGDTLDIPYITIKQMTPFGGCRLPKVRRKKFRLYRKKSFHIDSLLKI